MFSERLFPCVRFRAEWTLELLVNFFSNARFIMSLHTLRPSKLFEAFCALDFFYFLFLVPDCFLTNFDVSGKVVHVKDLGTTFTSF